MTCRYLKLSAFPEFHFALEFYLRRYTTKCMEWKMLPKLWPRSISGYDFPQIYKTAKNTLIWSRSVRKPDLPGTLPGSQVSLTDIPFGSLPWFPRIFLPEKAGCFPDQIRSSWASPMTLALVQTDIWFPTNFYDVVPLLDWSKQWWKSMGPSPWLPARNNSTIWIESWTHSFTKRYHRLCLFPILC